MFLMCFLEGLTSQPTRLTYVPCWRKIVHIPLKRASQQERNIFITSSHAHVQSTFVAGTDSRNIVLSLSNIVALLFSWPGSDVQWKKWIIAPALAFSSWKVNRSPENWTFVTVTSSEVGPLPAYDSTTVSSYLATLNSLWGMTDLLLPSNQT